MTSEEQAQYAVDAFENCKKNGLRNLTCITNKIGTVVLHYRSFLNADIDILKNKYVTIKHRAAIKHTVYHGIKISLPNDDSIVVYITYRCSENTLITDYEINDSICKMLIDSIKDYFDKVKESCSLVEILSFLIETLEKMARDVEIVSL